MFEEIPFRASAGETCSAQLKMSSSLDEELLAHLVLKWMTRNLRLIIAVILPRSSWLLSRIIDDEHEHFNISKW